MTPFLTASELNQYPLHGRAREPSLLVTRENDSGESACSLKRFQLPSPAHGNFDLFSTQPNLLGKDHGRHGQSFSIEV